MPRPWSDYSLREWLRITPFEQRWNYALYQLKARPVAWRLPERGDVQALRSGVSGRRVLVTTAFHDAEFIAWQASLIRRHIADCVHLVIDNSHDPEAALAIERVAEESGSLYAKLRPPPWTAAIDGGRAHASAMNWTWRNVLRPGCPSAFGFIDHDIFPTQPTDPFAPLQDHPIGGRVRRVRGTDRWFLWAGFCFFNFAAVSHLPLDFSLDWNAGLDTGGANWFVFRDAFDDDCVFDVDVRLERVAEDIPLDLARFEWLGDWLHYSTFSTPYDLPPEQWAALAARKRKAFAERLALSA